MDIVRRIPWELSSRTAGGASYQPSGDSYDLALNGHPFILATNNDRPYTREVKDSRKEMFDNFAEPGEYSLTDWWLRSQQDWGGGQGLTYQDPDVDERFNIKYKQSTGVNPWVPGQLQLLPDRVPVTSTLTSNVLQVFTEAYRSTAGVDSVWAIALNDMRSYNPVLNTETAIDFTGPGPIDTPTSLTSSGSTYYVSSDTAVYTGVDATAGSKLWTFADPAPGEQYPTYVKWAKGRLMLGYANSIYELVPPVGAAPHALPATAVFTHLNSAWRWRSMCDGPNAIYAAGNDGTNSAIYKLVLDVDGAAPILAAGGTITATFPPGEIVNSIYSYLGTFVGISTSQGFRIGEIDANGDIVYGPLLWNLPCYEISGYDRFFYVRVPGGVLLDPNQQDVRTPPALDVVDGLYRVDLGQRVQEQLTGSTRFAYSTDVFSVNLNDAEDENLPMRSFTILSNKFLFGIYGSDEVIGDTALAMYWPTDFELNSPGGDEYDLIESGWIQTGRVRFNTLEPKLFRYFSVRSPSPLLGDIDVDIIDEAGNPTRYITYTTINPPDVGDIPLSGIDTPRIYISLRFTLHRGVEPEVGAIMNGWQLKAVPAPIRQRIFTFTVLCFDTEMDKTGQEIGYEGYSLERLEAMETIAQRGDALMLQDLYNEKVSQVVIQNLQFIQLAPPGANTSNWGGYLTFQVKTVSDVI